jgi:hypothetical protein
LKRRCFQFDNIQITILIIMSPTTMEMSPLAELAPSSILKIPSVSRLPKTFPMTYGLILKTTITNIINVLLKILIISPTLAFRPYCYCLLLVQPQPSSRLGCL